MKLKTDTIAAKATPPGRSGIGIIRVSGPLVPLIIPKVLGKNIKARIANSCDFLSGDNKIIDQGVAIFFSAPNSFTGEDVLELQGHGGQVVMDLLLQRVIELGARLAKPGEFIERAFLNHKLDLAQVEAVADLINAASSQAAQNAIRSLQGEFSKKINKLVEQIIALRARTEATIDFVEEEEIEKITSNHYKKDLDNILLQIRELKKTAKQGVILQEGVTIVITGDPNVGKSSLLNYFSGRDTAIVTDIPGTTRDVLHVWTEIDGLPINFLDTAGIHDQPDVIEEEGIRRAWDEIKRADHVLLVVDAAGNREHDPEKTCAEFLKIIPAHAKIAVLYNKIDLTGEEAKIVKGKRVDSIYLSVKTGQGLDLLRQHLKEAAGFCAVPDGFSARRRHLEALEKAERFLQNITDGLFEANKPELIAEELRGAQMILGEITGEVTTDDLLDKIFGEFCIGK